MKKAAIVSAFVLAAVYILFASWSKENDYAEYAHYAELCGQPVMTKQQFDAVCDDCEIHVKQDIGMAQDFAGACVNASLVHRAAVAKQAAK